MSNSIIIENVSKSYKLGGEKSLNLRSSIASFFKNKNQSSDIFWALRDITFTAKQGESIGVIGKNGAGKSTLLKILSRITEPSKGRVTINGRLSSLLEVGTGFHNELTGRENVFLNGTILGMKRREVKWKFDEIVAFSGVEKFIDTPVKHYSSGMKVRLAFSVAAHLEPEILVIDEVLAVGDAEFQKKCLGKMGEVASQGRTVLFVSHNMAAIRKLCDRGILLNKGKVEKIGEVNDVLKSYLIVNKDESVYTPNTVKSEVEVSFSEVHLSNEVNEIQNQFDVKDKIRIHFHFRVNKLSHSFSVFCIIKDRYGSPVFSAERYIDRERMVLELDRMFLTRGNYVLHAFIHIPKVKQIDVAEDVCPFSISDSTSELAIHGNYDYGNVFGNYKWK